MPFAMLCGRGDPDLVAACFALGRLMFLAKMRAGRFVALQRVNAHQLGELEKIRDAPGAFQ